MNEILNYILMFLTAAAVIWIVASNIHRIFKVMLNSGVALAALVISNSVLPVCIGVNAVTCLFCGFLGVPGFITLYVLKFLM